MRPQIVAQCVRRNVRFQIGFFRRFSPLSRFVLHDLASSCGYREPTPRDGDGSAERR